MAKTATVRQIQVASLFMSYGWMPSGASAMTGNLTQESGVNLPSAFRTGKLDHGSQGLPQWRLDRLNDYEAFVKGKHPELVDNDDAMWAQYGRVDYQCEYIVIEVQRDYPRLDAALRKGGSVTALVAEICWEYERPSKAYANLANRQAQALLVFNSLPAGARTAHKTNIVAALDQTADAHENQQNAGAATATAAGAIAVGTGVHHFWNAIMWWEWVILAICVFCAITGVIAYIQHGSAAKLVRNAKPNVDPSAKPNTTRSPQAAPAAAKPVTVQQPSPQAAAAQAKADEQAAIDAALKKTTTAAQANQDPAPPAEPATGSTAGEMTMVVQTPTK